MVIFTKLHSTILYSSMLLFFTITTAATVRKINPKPRTPAPAPPPRRNAPRAVRAKRTKD